MSQAQIAGVAVNLIGKAAAVVLAATWAAANRRRGLEAAAGRTDGDREKELVRWSGPPGARSGRLLRPTMAKALPESTDRT